MKMISLIKLRSKEAASNGFPSLASILGDPVLVRAQTLAKVMEVVNRAAGVESRKIWYRLGEEAGEDMASFLIGKMKTKRSRIAKFLISESQSAGWGKVTFCGNRFGGIEGTIRIENSPLLSIDSTGDACQLYKGYIAGLLKRIYDIGGVECTDGSCLRKGGPFCELRVKKRREKWLRSILI